jgi:hypothetical protein
LASQHPQKASLALQEGLFCAARNKADTKSTLFCSPQLLKTPIELKARQKE